MSGWLLVRPCTSRSPLPFGVQVLRGSWADTPLGQRRDGAGTPWSLGKARIRCVSLQSPGSGSSLLFFQASLWSGEVPASRGIIPPWEPRGASLTLLPLPAPCLWPWQATGSAKDESRSLVSPLAAIAVKLEQRPANKAPPPLPYPPSPLPEALHFTQVPTGEFAHLLLLFA